MRHYILTRAAYGPDVPIEVNRYRLELMRGITAQSLASQTFRDATWLVLVHPADPLQEERRDVLAGAGLPFLTRLAGDMDVRDRRDRPWGPWKDYIDWSDATLTTRIDDDDAFAPWALQAFRDAAEEWTQGRGRKRRRIFVMPVGWRISAGRVDERRDHVNQFTTLYAPRGDRCCIMDMNHTSQRRLALVSEVTEKPGWLWLRHGHARSALSRASNIHKERMVPITDDIRSGFAVDWPLVESVA